MKSDGYVRVTASSSSDDDDNDSMHGAGICQRPACFLYISSNDDDDWHAMPQRELAKMTNCNPAAVVRCCHLRNLCPWSMLVSLRCVRFTRQ